MNSLITKSVPFASARLLVEAAAFACPFCDSKLSKEVSAGIFGADFAANAAFTLLPLFMLGMVIAVIHLALPLVLTGSIWPDPHSAWTEPSKEPVIPSVPVTVEAVDGIQSV
jgi:hypothetical protein